MSVFILPPIERKFYPILQRKSTEKIWAFIIALIISKLHIWIRFINGGVRAKIQQKGKKSRILSPRGESLGVSPDDSPSGELAAPIRAADLCNLDGKTVYSFNKDLT
jgi:hypothetical protein